MSLSNAQVDAAEEIKCLMVASDAAARDSVEKALEAGRLLVEAKANCPHGTWLPFLERAEIHERQARRLMQLAGSNLKSDTVSDLGGIKAALEFLAKRSKAVKLMQSIELTGWAHAVRADGTVDEDAARSTDLDVLERDIDRFVELMPLFDEMLRMVGDETTLLPPPA